MKTYKLLILITLALSSICWGQTEAKPISPITEQEQLEFLKKHDKALQKTQTAAYLEGEQAKRELTEFVDKLLSDRKLKPQDVAICFGTGQGICSDVPEMTLVFKPAPKPEKSETPKVGKK
jgi:hypothetical protein